MSYSLSHYFLLLFLSVALLSCSSEQSEESGESNNFRTSESEALDRSNLSPEEIGQHISSTAQQRLGRNLMKAIEKRGFEYAVSYCRLKASEIVDSVAFEQNATVQRVSDKPRNPRNAANDKELEYIQRYQQALAKAEDWDHQIDQTDQRNTFYTPIITQPLCLNCHGELGSDVEDKLYVRIRSQYPQDKAIGYGLTEVRGLWKIQWDRK
jgi:hypothetical protein